LRTDDKLKAGPAYFFDDPSIARG